METDREMSMEEIEAQFDSEWVLIADPKTDDQLNVVRGRVRYHSKDRSSVDQAAIRMRSKRDAILYIGEFPEDTQFLL
ncbi:MAG: hypothetical protein AAGH89_05670 [Verrucomicrobiota bacterium]